MIIDDDYCQYDTFRIINKADTDAIAAFKNDAAAYPEKEDRQAQYAAWQQKADELSKAAEESEETEDSVYQLTYAKRMALCWSRELSAD